MRQVLKYFSFMIWLALASCSTPYQSQGLTGGFSTTQLDTNVFQVSFKGNGYTSPEKAADYTLLKSAELALDNGFRYFQIIDSKQYSKISTYTTPTTVSTNINMNHQGTAQSNSYNTTYSGTSHGHATSTISGGETTVVQKPRSNNTIVCYKEKPEGFSYNAEMIKKSLRDKYGINPAQ